jgi:hypothetical protein
MFSFTTEQTAPAVYDPIPLDGEQFIPINILELSFKLMDPQGDPMDYTVETKPDIGSGSGTGVGDGTYTVDVSGLENLTEYLWYVNVTDGTNWKHKIFCFTTEPRMVFNPFDEGWQYRKEITIDHNEVDGELIDFPILISTTDDDLRQKAQNDGDDLLFMDGPDVATRLYHEVEYFEGSTGLSIIWVKIPMVHAQEDTSFYIYYGNEECGNQDTREAIWMNGYTGVYHLADETDSTSNHYNGIRFGDPDFSSTQKIGKGVDLDGNDAIIDLGTPSPNTDDYSFSCWGSSAYLGDTQELLCFRHTAHYEVKTISTLILGPEDPNIKPRSHIRDEDGTQDWLYGFNLGLDEWHLYHLVRNDNTFSLYVDGVVVDSFTDGNIGNINWDDPNGCQHIGASEYPTGNMRFFLNGQMDETRILVGKGLSSEWISTEFNNQNDPSDFLSFGPEEP